MSKGRVVIGKYIETWGLGRKCNFRVTHVILELFDFRLLI